LDPPAIIPEDEGDGDPGPPELAAIEE